MDIAQQYHIPQPKICTKCGELKRLVEFSLHKGFSDGRNSKCRTCYSEYYRERLAAGTIKSRYESNKSQFDESLKSGINSTDPLLIQRLQKRLATEHKICRSCSQNKPLHQYYVRIRHGKWINVRTSCKDCFNKRTASKLRSYSSAFFRYRRNAHAKGHDFSLTKLDIKQYLEQDCFYCGGSDILMTVDRQNSSIGYTRDNCVACCIRCNLVKSDMPFAAWTLVAQSMRKARENGLFGDWIGRRNFASKSPITR